MNVVTTTVYIEQHTLEMCTLCVRGLVLFSIVSSMLILPFAFFVEKACRNVLRRMFFTSGFSVSMCGKWSRMEFFSPIFTLPPRLMLHNPINPTAENITMMCNILIYLQAALVKRFRFDGIYFRCGQKSAIRITCFLFLRLKRRRKKRNLVWAPLSF